MRLSRRSVGAFITAALLIVSLAPGALAAAEDSFLSRINEERSGRGLPALVSHWDLVDDAEAHSEVMKAADNLHHNPNLGSVTTGWMSLGENVGVGPSVSSIHNAFMDSPPHRGNVLGDFTHVGIGAVRESEDRIWVTVVFMKSSEAPPATSTTTPPTTTASPRPVTSAPVPTTIPTRATTLPPAETAAEASAAVSAAEPAAVIAAPVRVRLRHSPRPL